MTRAARALLGASFLAAIAASAGSPAALGAQSLPLKRPNVSAVGVACPVFQAPPAPVRQQIDEANRLATLGQESSLEGDHRAARDMLSQAVVLNPRDATLAYRLGREYEELAQTDDAVRQYCRYLSLAPNAGDAPQIGTRLAHLLSPPVIAKGNDVVTAFHTGLTDFDARDWSGAVAAFGLVVSQDSALSAAVYNRGLAHDRDDDPAAAVRDYSRYLQLEPQASDAVAVRARVDALRSGIPSAGTAFALGLLPGGGQFYTGQPVLGAVVIAGVAGSVALAVQSRTITRDTTYIGPFGGTYPGTYTQTQHPNLVVGAAAGGGILLFGAIEAAIVAHGRGAGLSEAAGPAGTRSALLPHLGPVMVDLPTLARAPDGLRWQFPLRVEFR
jgi:tetratricopeptide (TPR) repeat protein